MNLSDFRPERKNKLAEEMTHHEGQAANGRNYLRDVVTGKVAMEGLNNLDALMQRAMAGDQQAALELGMNFTPGAILSVGGKMGRMVKPFSKPLENSIADAADELASAGAKIDPDGMITVYHRTSPENAALIRKTGKMRGAEDGLFFSTAPVGQAEGFGSEIVELRLPANQLVLDDIFDAEAHVRLPLKRAGEELDLKDFIVSNKPKK